MIIYGMTFYFDPWLDFAKGVTAMSSDGVMGR